MESTQEGKKIIEPKKIIGVSDDILFTLRKYHGEDMQEFLCPDGEEVYKKDEERKQRCKDNLEKAFENRLKPDSEEQLKYNAVIDSILDYKDHNEYKRKTSFKYKVLKFLKLTK